MGFQEIRQSMQTLYFGMIIYAVKTQPINRFVSPSALIKVLFPESMREV